MKALEGFEMRRVMAKETLDTDGQCPNEGRGLVGARRVYESEACASFALDFHLSFWGLKAFWFLVHHFELSRSPLKMSTLTLS